MIIKNIKDYTLFDSETTGLDFSIDRIVSHGVIRVRDNKIVEELEIMVNQPIEIPTVATNIHGITNEMMKKDGKDPKESCKKVLDFMGNDIIVGLNNTCYDYQMLEMECNRYGLPRPKIENWFDVGLLAKGLFIGNLYNEKELFYKYAFRIKDIRAKGVKYNLNFLTKEMGCDNLRDEVKGRHGAVVDLKMTKNVFDKMKEKYYNK